MGAHSQLISQLIVSGVLIAATTFVHAIFVAVDSAFVRASIGGVRGPMRVFRDAFVLVFAALILMLAHGIEIGMWAYAFLELDLFATWEEALYFSAVSYTTLGFGDVLLPPEWGLLSGSAAANGLLLFGLSAAFLIEATSRLRMGAK